MTAVFIFDELLAAAKARGAIPQVTWDFTATLIGVVVTPVAESAAR